ncbi:LysR family transcriptional regulator [Allokutzneria sp. NRRL B-24872]|uniref:LysR family transcriptional regulator n=1 Tax=Allokutzneria sp. NRRL B-24872 TaxID=1137961 RepID=UPI000A3642FB|nr:LysR family transcriptional regulator [Allokutzneria sp. NRRL B-24872]
MDLGQLRTFGAVYRAGSLTAAATVLGITQPAVSVQVKALEERLGRPLFRRLPRGVAPTAFADELARRVGPHLDALAGVELELTREEFARTVRLGGPAEAMSVLVLPALSGLVRRGLRLRVGLGLADDLLVDLAEGRLDLVLSSVRPRRKGLVVTPLADEEFVLVAAAGAEFPDLAAAPMLAYAEELPMVRRYWRTVFGGPPPHNAAVVVPDLRGLLAAVLAGAGITVLPKYLCAAELESGELVLLHDPDEPPINTLYLATRSDQARLPHIRAVTETLTAAAKHW